MRTFIFGSWTNPVIRLPQRHRDARKISLFISEYLNISGCNSTGFVREPYFLIYLNAARYLNTSTLNGISSGGKHPDSSHVI